MLVPPSFSVIRLGLTLAWLAIGAFLIAHLASLFMAEAVGAKPGSIRIIPIRSISKTFTPLELGNMILESSVFPNEPLFPGLNAPIGITSNTGLNVELMGTVVGGKSLRYAILQSSQSGIQVLYRLGDVVPQLGTIVAIDRHRVVIALPTGGETILEAGWMRQSDPRADVKPSSQLTGSEKTNQVVLRREIAEAFSNIPHLLKQAHAIPVMSADGMTGLSFVSIQSASIFDRLGFQVGDVLKAINGVPLRDPGTVLTALNRIQDEPSVSLDVVRQNENITLNYEIR